ncbi:phosphatase domain-containing protein [Algoriphagus sp.]|uniref:App1 family protein n=1 Tax=Algoriphagus sp. TaxID=1872435 RepID=UPI002636DD1F|nr:phosphatase domain-containing protein [Algoriphagus sp.]
MKWIGKLDLIQIEPFLALSNGTQVYIKGRVISAYKQSRPKARNNSFKNILAAIRRYAVTSIPETTVLISKGDSEEKVTSDQDGVFECVLPSSGETQVQFSFPEKEEGINYQESEIPIYEVHSSNGVISDIDDTILISHATQIGKKFWLSVSKNAYTRRPFPGVSEFYQKLSVHGNTEVFYVSSSDWSLFDLIRDFLEFRKIPLGPILLKDKHINLKNIWTSGGGSHDHKFDKIRFLFSFFPEMNFILVGDSGQHDPEIYAQLKEEFPDRIKTIFIREIKPNHFIEEKRDYLQATLGFHFVKTTHDAIQLAKNLALFSS